MKIKNKFKFIRTISLMMLFIIVVFMIFSKTTYSGANISYEENVVCRGDTLWSIANEQSKTNKYFENKDIREVVEEIKNSNDIKDSKLYQGQKIRIPIYE